MSPGFPQFSETYIKTEIEALRDDYEIPTVDEDFPNPVIMNNDSGEILA